MLTALARTFMSLAAITAAKVTRTVSFLPSVILFSTTLLTTKPLRPP